MAAQLPVSTPTLGTQALARRVSVPTSWEWRHSCLSPLPHWERKRWRGASPFPLAGNGDSVACLHSRIGNASAGAARLRSHLLGMDAQLPVFTPTLGTQALARSVSVPTSWEWRHSCLCPLPHWERKRWHGASPFPLAGNGRTAACLHSHIGNARAGAERLRSY